MDSARIADLPLDSRNVVELVTLGPCAIQRQLGRSRRMPFALSTQFHKYANVSKNR